MGVSVREALTRRLDLLSEEQALAVLTRMDEEEAIRAVPAPPEVVGRVKEWLANPGPAYTNEEVRVRLGLEPIPYPTVNRIAPVVPF